MSKNEAKKQFTELYYFPEKYLEKELVIEGFFGGGDRLSEADEAEFKRFGLNYRDFMTFSMYDREAHDFIYLCAPHTLAAKISELEDGQSVSIKAKVIAVGTDIDPREPVLLVSDLTPGEEIFKLDRELLDEDDEDEDDYWDEFDDEEEIDETDGEDELEDEFEDDSDGDHQKN